MNFRWVADREDMAVWESRDNVADKFAHEEVHMQSSMSVLYVCKLFKQT